MCDCDVFAALIKMGNCCAKKGGTGAPEPEYSDEDIRRKFDNMPRLTNEEKIVLKSSWKVIRKKVNTVSYNLDSSNIINRSYSI